MSTARVSLFRRSVLGLVALVAGLGIVASTAASATAAPVTTAGQSVSGHQTNGPTPHDWWWP